MSIDKLIMEFSGREHVPVQVDEVVAALRALGVNNEINFFDPDIDQNVLKGAFELRASPPSIANQPPVVNIHTAEGLPIAEKRLVQVKEMLHVLDHAYFRVNTFEKVVDLIDKIAIPESLQDPENDGHHAMSDRVALYHACAILFPLEARDLLMTAYRSGALDLQAIADYVDIPVKYVALVMSDHWPVVHGRMIRPQRIVGPGRVCTFGGDGAKLEVISVPIGTSPFSFAKSMLTRRRNGVEIVSLTIETDDGTVHTMTHAEVIALRD